MGTENGEGRVRLGGSEKEKPHQGAASFFFFFDDFFLF